MKILESLYYQLEQYQTNYRFQGPGRLDLGRLIQGEACWQYTSASPSTEKKTIVVIPSRLGVRSVNGAFQFFQFLKSLEASGFKIIFWQPLSTIKFDDVDDFWLEYGKFKPPTQYETRALLQRKISKTLNLTHDSFEIFDIDTINRYLAERFPENALGYPFHQMLFFKHLIIDFVTERIEGKNIPIALDCYQCALQPYIKAIHTIYPNIKWITQWSRLIISSKLIAPLVLDKLPPLYGYTLHREDLHKMKHLLLDLNDPLDNELFGEFILQFKNLYTLALSCTDAVKKLKITLQIPPQALTALTNLRTLIVNHDLLDRESLNAILLHASKSLYSLRLCSFSFNVNESLGLHYFSSLISLELIQQPLHIDTLLRLLNNAPKLNSIIIDTLEISSDYSFPQSHPTHAEIIRLDLASTSPLPYQALVYFMSAMPNLKHLTLKALTPFPESLTALPVCSSLSILKLNAEHLTAPMLHLILSAMPNLKCIQLSNLNIPKDQAFIAYPALERLLSIKITSSNITIDWLFSLITSAPNTQEVVIFQSTLTEKATHGIWALTHSPQGIILQQSTVDLNAFYSLQKALPKLQALSIQHCTFTSIDGLDNTLPTLDFYILETCKNMPWDTLLNLLTHAPRLRSLNVILPKDVNPSSLSGALPALMQVDKLSLTVENETDCNTILTVLGMFPMLTSVKIVGNVTGRLREPLIKLKELNEIHLHANNPSLLLHLINHAHQITNLTIASPIALVSTLSDREFAKISILKVLNNNLEDPAVQDVIHRCSSLRTLDLQGSTPLHSHLLFQLLTHPSLKEILLSKACLDFAYSTCQGTDYLPKLMKLTIRQYLLSTPSVKKEEIDTDPAASFRLPPKARPSFHAFKPQHPPYSFEQSHILAAFNQFTRVAIRCPYDLQPLQRGICLALSEYFIKTPYDTFKQHLTLIVSWNGKLESLDGERRRVFNTLYGFIERNYLDVRKSYAITIFDSTIETHLAKLSKATLQNPWHSVAIQKITPTQYAYYNPNSNAPSLFSDIGALASFIRNDIGHVIGARDLVYVPRLSRIAFHLHDVNLFCKNGGLLMLNYARNKDEVIRYLNTHPADSSSLYEGLKLYSNAEGPAWLTLLNNINRHVVDKALSLMTHVIRDLKHAWSDFLGQLLEREESHKKYYNQFTFHLKSQLHHRGLLLRFKDALIEAQIKKEASKALSTWHKPTLTIRPGEEEPLKALFEKEQRILLQCAHQDNVESMQNCLIAYAKKHHIPLYVIYEPDDLNLNHPTMIQHHDTFTLRAGLGGALYDFLEANKHRAPLLLIDYSSFAAQERVQYNHLLEAEPRIDLYPLPRHTTIIGLQNNSAPNCYNGTDFISRFSQVYTVNLSTSIAPPYIRYDQSEVGYSSELTIPLDGEDNWKERLVGRWRIHAESLTFEKGPLLDIIESQERNTRICLQNAPWRNEHFTRFMRRIAQTGLIETPFATYKLHQALNFHQTSDYDIEALKHPIAFVGQGLHPRCESYLTSQTYGQLFQSYAGLSSNQRLISTPGLIEQHRDRTLYLNVMQNLTSGQWAQISRTAARYMVRLHLHLAPDVHLPFDIPQRLTHKRLMRADSLPMHLYISDDPDTTLMVLHKRLRTHHHKTPLVIDLTELEPQLLIKETLILQQIKDQTISFYYQQNHQWLYQALTNHELVILKGTPSVAMQEALLLFLNELKDKDVPKLHLITQRKDAPNYIALLSVNESRTHEAEKRQALMTLGFGQHEIESLDTTRLNESPLSSLVSLLHWQRFHHHDTPWTWFKEPPETIYHTTSLEDIERKLEHYPFVFILGPTGSGKTTLISDTLTRRVPVYFGVEALKDWAQNRAPCTKILFIDEANLTHHRFNFSLFEGLFHPAPAIFVNGVYYPLADDFASLKHRIIFAGNPNSYCHHRQLSPFFQRHANTLWHGYAPIESVLKPLFSAVVDEALSVVEKRLLSDALMILYQNFATKHYGAQMITPRELEMIIVLCLAHPQFHDASHTTQIIDYFCHWVTKHLVDNDRMSPFMQDFKPRGPERTARIDDATFALTPSRKAPLDVIECLLTWRENNHLHRAPTTLKGLGGLILQGEPGTGKSQWIQRLLRQHGYHEDSIEHGSSLGAKSFITLPASLEMNVKLERLQYAFLHGLLVIMDEFNSAPYPEEQLNQYLTGRDASAKRHSQSGFFIIATQNPSSHEGRYAMSPALKRRFLILDVPGYNQDEVAMILEHKKLNASQAKCLAQVFIEKRREGEQANKTPLPSLREVLGVAEHLTKTLSTYGFFRAPTDTPLTISPRATLGAE